LKIEGTQAKI